VRQEGVEEPFQIFQDFHGLGHVLRMPGEVVRKCSYMVNSMRRTIAARFAPASAGVMGGR